MNQNAPSIPITLPSQNIDTTNSPAVSPAASAAHQVHQQVNIANDPPTPVFTPDVSSPPNSPIPVNHSQVQYMPVSIRSLHSTSLQPTQTVIPIVQGSVVASQHNLIIIADDTGIAAVYHSRGTFTGVTGVSIHFNGGVTVSTNTSQFPVITLTAGSTMKRCNMNQIDISPFLTSNLTDPRRHQGLSMVLHLANRVRGLFPSTTKSFLATTSAGESFVLTPYNALMSSHFPDGFYLVINIRKSSGKQGSKIYFYADSSNNAIIIPWSVPFPLPESPRRIDLPESTIIKSIPEAFTRTDSHALFTFHGATVTGMTYTQPSTQATSTGKRFQKVSFFLGNGGHSSILTIFEESMFLPESCLNFSV
jgi:hypothetical protein